MANLKKFQFGNATSLRTDERTKIAVQLLAAQLTLESGESVSVNQAVWTSIKTSFPDIADKAIEFYEAKRGKTRGKGKSK